MKKYLLLIIIIILSCLLLKYIIKEDYTNNSNVAIYMWGFKPNEKKSIPKECINNNKKYFNPKIINESHIIDLIKNNSHIFNNWNNIPKWIMKADLGRLIYIYYNGGVYLDIDCNINKNFKEYLNDNLVLFIENNNVNINKLGPREIKDPEHSLRIANYAFGTNIKKHPFLKDTINECIKRLKILLSEDKKKYTNEDILWVCGPDVITTIYHKNKNKYNNILLLDTSYLQNLNYGSWR